MIILTKNGILPGNMERRLHPSIPPLLFRQKGDGIEKKIFGVIAPLEHSLVGSTPPRGRVTFTEDKNYLLTPVGLLEATLDLNDATRLRLGLRILDNILLFDNLPRRYMTRLLLQPLNRTGQVPPSLRVQILDRETGQTVSPEVTNRFLQTSELDEDFQGVLEPEPFLKDDLPKSTLIIFRLKIPSRQKAA